MNTGRIDNGSGGPGVMDTKPTSCALPALRVNGAEQMGKNQAAQREADLLVSKLIEGNVNLGKGTMNLFGDIYYLRGDSGARFYCGNSQD